MDCSKTCSKHSPWKKGIELFERISSDKLFNYPIFSRIEMFTNCSKSISIILLCRHHFGIISRIQNSFEVTLFQNSFLCKNIPVQFFDLRPNRKFSSFGSLFEWKPYDSFLANKKLIRRKLQKKCQEFWFLSVFQVCVLQNYRLNCLRDFWQKREPISSDLCDRKVIVLVTAVEILIDGEFHLSRLILVCLDIQAQISLILQA